ARGALQASHEADRRQWIIPACAGSTPSIRSNASQIGDHPRVRGEHLLLGPALTTLLGSSPRARGAHLMTSEYISPHRKTASLCASASQPAASASLRAVTSSRRPHELYLRLNFRRF